MKKYDFNEEYGYDEITATRNEFAEVLATAVCKILEDSPSEIHEELIDICATLGSVIMHEFFDSNKDDHLEVEK